MKTENGLATELSMLSGDPHSARPVSFGSRARAAIFRQKLESKLSAGKTVVIDFEGVSATQSFIDELVGVLILEMGPEILQSVKFRGCSEDVKAIVRFVASDRADQYESTRRAATRQISKLSAIHAH